MQAAISATHMPMRAEHKTRDLGWQELGTETAMVYTDLLLVVVHSFYIVLFSALEKTQCALVACDSK